VPTFERTGLRLHYDVVGSGPPVLAIHGATGTGPYEWSDLANALSDRYRFIVPDLRGHGRSDHRAGEMGIEYVNEDLLALISHENLGQPHLLAFSFGAEAALELELTHPGTSGSLVLVSPGLGDPKSSVPTREQLEAGWPRSLRRLHAERHGEDHWLDVMVELCERAALRPKADLDALASIGCPVLLVVGGNDDPRRLRQASVLAEAHGRCQLTVIDGARHAVHKERGTEVAAIVGAFLDEVTPPADRPRQSGLHSR
jgi:pimeloyl-ACP methyl ester carboxylesterase